MTTHRVLSDHLVTIANDADKAIAILNADGDPIDYRSLADAYAAILRSTTNSLRAAAVAVRTYEDGISNLIGGQDHGRRS